MYPDEDPTYRSHLYYSEDRLHPFWSTLLMMSCVNAALLVGIYAAGGNAGWFGMLVVGVLLLAAVLIYRTS